MSPKPITFQRGLTGFEALQVGSAGTAISALTVYEVALPVTGAQPASVARVDYTVSGVQADDVVVGFNTPATTGKLVPASARVKDVNTIEVAWVNTGNTTLSFSSSVVTAAFTVARRA